MSAILAAVRWHQLQLQQRPYLTNWITGVALMGIGDRVAQEIEARDRPRHSGPGAAAAELDEQRESWTRTGILSSWSAIISPWWTFWYRMLARRYPGNVVRWVAMTAGLSVPFNAAFFSYSTAVESLVTAALKREPRPAAEDVRDAVEAKLRSRLLPTVATSLAVWVPVNAANFTLVPLHNRNLVASAFACGWNVFLSLQQHHRHVQLEKGDAAGGTAGAAAPTASELELEGASHREPLGSARREGGRAGEGGGGQHVPAEGADSRASPATESG